jgi:hypothetical protein
LRRYRWAVVEAAGGRPLVVFVDDAHLLDNGSATLVHQLALTRAATVLAAVRSGEATPDSVEALWKDGPAERIEVDFLDAAAIEELLVTVLEGPVDASSVRQLVARCRGNPLFLRELVTGALETRTLVDEGGIWRLRGGLLPTARLVELVALRLADLSGPERGVLELLAVGEPLDQGELAQLADPAAVETLERRGLITSRTEGRRVQVRLGHRVYGDVVRVGISALRERVIARYLADVIEATGGPRRDDTLLLPSLRLVGGGGNAELLGAGAVAARARHDHALAERLARAAIDEGAASRLASWPPRPPTSKAGMTRPSTSWPPWPRTLPATSSELEWPSSASTTRTSFRVEPTFDCSTTRSTPSPIRSGVTRCSPDAFWRWVRAAGCAQRWRPHRHYASVLPRDRSPPRT